MRVVSVRNIKPSETSQSITIATQLQHNTQGSKLLGFWISGTPPKYLNLGAGFLAGNPGIVPLMDNLILGFF